VSQSLQRVLVRMLHDPALVARVQAGESLPELDDRENALLERVDPRAFATDEHRRGRVLTALMQEFPASAALASQGGRDLAAVDAFMSSPSFHRCIMERGVLALAFGSWLRASAGPIADFEAAMVRARRRREPRGSGWAVAAGTWPQALPEGTAGAWQGLRAALGADPVEALVNGAVELAVDRAPALPEATEFLVFRAAPDGEVTLHWSSEGFHALMQACLEPAEPAALLELAQSLGAEAGEDEQLLQGMRQDGWLRFEA
jgi:hypothetical protein